MGNNDLVLFAHLMRRAGFGATRSELEEHADRTCDKEMALLNALGAW